MLKAASCSCATRGEADRRVIDLSVRSLVRANTAVGENVQKSKKQKNAEHAESYQQAALAHLDGPAIERLERSNAPVELRRQHSLLPEAPLAAHCA